MFWGFFVSLYWAMRRILPLLALATLVSCGPPPDLLADAKKPTYFGTWRTGTSGADYKVLDLLRDNSAALFGMKHNVIAPIELTGDEMVLRMDKATSKDPNFVSVPEYPGDKFPFHLKRISETNIEVTDESGLFFGVKTPLAFEKITQDQADQTNAQIMQRSANGG